MKYGKFVLAVAALLIAGVGAQAGTRQVVVNVSDAYVPGGFDSTSDAYVVASGVFPNGCYRWSHADVKDISSTLHEIKAVASVSEGMCIMVLVPYQQEIHLGKMASGTHTLRFANDDGTFMEKTLKVE